MTEFKLVPHSLRDATIVEVWIDNQLKAVIYPAENGIKIIAQQFDDLERWGNEEFLFKFH